jgi:hypothetical protein
MNPWIQLQKATPRFLITLLIVCLGSSQKSGAVTPAPDGGYPGGNTAEGQNALFGLTTGGFNTAVGFFSLRSNTTNSLNTAIGAGALLANTADSNTATGAGALLSNTTGSVNTAYGAFALFHNTTGGGHTAVGYNALAATNASDFLEGNTAVGSSALADDTDGNANTAIGFAALVSNTSGGSDTAIGNLALGGSTTGSNNTAVGAGALESNTTGSQNTANGAQALLSNNVSSGNTATGYQALMNNLSEDNTANGRAALANNTTGIANTAMGVNALFNNTTGSGDTALGADAGSNVSAANNVICIGSAGADVSNTTWINNVYGVTTQNGTTAPVIVSADGQLGTVASAERFKKDIATMDKASEVILSLRPVTFHYKTDTKGTPQFGLIAEEVAKVNPALVLPDKEGKPYTVRYDAVNTMLLNEFLKEHAKVGQLKKDFESKIAEQQKQIDVLKRELQEQRALIQKVSTQLELSKSAPQTVLNNQ